MIWFTWRQFRTQTWIALGGLAVLTVVLAVSGHNLAHIYAENIGACHSDCANAISNFRQAAGDSISDKINNAALVIMYVLPALIGIFWGAPLIARELETGTHRLAWNQSVTRTRWLATKLAVIGVASIATTGLLSWAVTAAAHHIDRAAMNRITPLVYDARGIVPIGYAAFAFTLGVAAGMLIRRTVPAMAATLAIYVSAVASMPLLRGHLIPARHITPPLNTSDVREFMIGAGGSTNTMRVIGSGSPSGAWVLSNQTITTSGHVFTGPPDPQFCGPDHGPQSCLNWVGSLGLREDIMYQPASHFWPLQWAETGIFLAIAVVLAGFCLRWTRRRLT